MSVTRLEFCGECGAVIHDEDLHDAWHDFVEAAIEKVKAL